MEGLVSFAVFKRTEKVVELWKYYSRSLTARFIESGPSNIPHPLDNIVVTKHSN